jgi:hypothetical protein
MDGIGDRRVAALEVPCNVPVACAGCVKVFNGLGARLAVPHDRVRLKWIDDQELKL